MGERPGEGRGLHLRLVVYARERNRLMQGDDGLLPVPAERRTGKLAFDQGTLRRMQEHRTVLPMLVQRLPQFLEIREYPETALRVGAREGIGLDRCRSSEVRR
jgi:hypothetical protein